MKKLKAFFISASFVLGLLLATSSVSANQPANGQVTEFIAVPPPVLTITSPQNNARLTNAVLLVKGRVNNGPAVSNIVYSLDGGPWLTTNLAGGSNWVISVNLTPGTNRFRAFAQDTSGITSKTNSITVDYVVMAPMVVQIVGSGMVALNYNGKSLDIGTTYSMKATAATGFAFYYWNDGLTMTNSPTLIFTMMSNLTATAYFKDITPPKISITSPAANQKYSNTVLVVTGKASDNVAVTAVGARLNGGGWVTAVGLTNWSAEVGPVKSGGNTVQAYAMDAAGNLATNTVQFTGILPPDWAPDDITNRIVQMNLTNGLSVTAGFGATTFSQTDTNTSGDSGVGDYAYVKFSTNGATLQLAFTAPPSITNDGPENFLLQFTNLNTGVFTNLGTLDMGTFVVTNAPELLPLFWQGHNLFLTNSADSSSTRLQLVSGKIVTIKKGSGLPVLGSYTATRYNPVCAMLAVTDTYTKNVSYVQLTFTSKTGGSYEVNTFGTAGVLRETEDGTFILK